MEPTTHIVQRLSINLNLPAEKSAREIQSHVRDICTRIITEILDEVFSDTIENHSLLRIDKLSIDLGDLDRFYLERDFIEKLPLKLKEGLENCLKEQALIAEILKKENPNTSNDRVEPDYAAQKLHPVVSKLEVLAFFLLYGRLPWWEGLGKMNINELLSELLLSNEQEVKFLLTKILAKSEVQKRIDLQLSKENTQWLHKLLPKQFSDKGNISKKTVASSTEQKAFDSLQFIAPDFAGRYNPIDLFSYFLKRGSIPYWGKVSNKRELQELFENLISSQSEEMAKVLHKSIQKAFSRTRIIWQFASHDIDKIVDVLAQYTTSERQSFITELKRVTSSTRFTKNEYEVILRTLSEIDKHSTDHQTLAELIQKSYEEKSRDTSTSSENSSANSVGRQPDPDNIDVLHYFFHQGHLPWWARVEEEFEPDRWIVQLAEDEKGRLLDLLDEILSAPQVRKRMLAQLKDETLFTLLKLRLPQMSGFLMTIKLALDEYYEQEIKGKVNIDGSKIRWEPVWIAIQESPEELPSETYTKAVIQYLSLLLNIPFTQLKNKLLHISYQAIEREEVRFYPLVDTLKVIEEDIEARDSSEKKQSEISGDSRDEEELVKDKDKLNVSPDGHKEGSGSQERNEKPTNETDEDSEDIDTDQQSENLDQQPESIDSESEEMMSSVEDLVDGQQSEKQTEQNEKEILSKLERGKPIYPKEVLTLLHKAQVRHKLASIDYDIVFRRVLEALSPDEAETIIRFLDELTTKDPVLVAANKEQILLKLADYDSTNLSDKEVAQKDTSSNMPMKFTLVHEESIFSSTDAIYIRNAGMVILWPFLRQYFEMLDMLDGSQFTHEAYAIRAVHLLQYLVTGQTETPEYELVLNKILCNLPIETPIPLGIELTEEEEDISSQMMNAILNNWTTIGMGTSVEGLREVFLLREGKLVHQPDGWHLKVTTGSYDMLLDTMPWGISMIKLSWMHEMLYVEWR